jgi:ferredoxin
MGEESMTDQIYRDLAGALDSLPGGYPRTKSGVEITILQKLFEPKEAGLATHLSAGLKTVEAIAERAGLEAKVAKSMLKAMYKKGLIEAGFDKSEAKPTWKFGLMPFVVGFYEEQFETLDHDLAHLIEHYWVEGGLAGIMKYSPALHRVIPAHGAVKREYILPYDEIVPLIEGSESFGLRECICRKQQEVLASRKCDFPLEMCINFTTEKRRPGPHSITREQTLDVLRRAEVMGLVHTVANLVEGIYYVCNCCGCCCTVLRGITEFGIESSVAKANYLAVVDAEMCSGCGVCIDRCQVNAVTLINGVAVVDENSCIGCGLCSTTCESDAMHLEKKPDAGIVTPPADRREWGEQRLRNRGML